MTNKARFGAVLGLSLTLLPVAAGATAPLSVTSPFSYSFSAPGVLEESRSMSDSSSPYFWLSSGANLIIEDGVGKTLSAASVPELWRNIYSRKDPVDTSGGMYPENVFSLITRSEWENFSQEVTFTVLKTNPTDSYNRDAYSGFFLFSNYSDQNNYYYAGIRMDGQAVVKKKENGVFYTLGSLQVFGQSKDYDKHSKITLIPQNKTMRLRLETRSLSEGSSELILSLDTGDGRFVTLLDVTDKNALRGASYAGIESDFMDVVLDDYNLSK